ncbi:hypothetical protein KAU92_00700 [Candidatus Bathyarchaeota archaeon]|nr:hypothetical protein [Candidatus Bathyarchaeota archaeon]
MSMQKIHVGVILTIATIGIVVSVLATSLLVAYQGFPNAGNVRAVGVGVYWDNACTSNVTDIDWQFLEPGDTANKTVFIKNGGTLPLVLTMTTDNWNPTTASDYITLSWDRENYVLNTTAPVVQAVLTLSVSSDISGVGAFSFDITITGTEYE